MNISVIIPVWNREQCIVRAMESVLSQTLSPQELIVIDDASTDDTYHVVKDYFDNYRGITTCVLLQSEHSGMAGKVRNIGIRASKGDWIAFLDSDDAWHPEKLEKQSRLLKETNTVWCHTRERWIRNGKEISQKKHRHERQGNIFNDALKKCIIGPSTVMIDKTIFYDIGYFREDLEICEDYELWLRFLNTHEISYLDEPLTIKYAGHENQLSQKYGYIEKFRIDVLFHLIQDGEFEYNNKITAQQELKYKQGIWEQGRRKRNA